jgi:predicted dehydrogenase
MSQPIKFAVVGTGWRAEMFLRLAGALPEQLEAVLVAGRTSDSAGRVATRWGIPGASDLDSLSGSGAEFVIAAVPWAATPSVTEELVAAGHPVLAETPPAPDLAGLRAVWAALGPKEDMVQVGEQYLRMPGHAARLAVVQRDVIGHVNSVEVASTHLYHAAALTRGFLGTGLTPVTVTARAFTAPMLNPLHGFDWVKEPAPERLTTHIASLDFGDGRYGLYNFVENQWFNPLLARRIAVRGTLGELVDDKVIRWSGTAPVLSRIEYRRVGMDMNLEGNEVRTASFEGETVYENPCQGSNLSEDDVAVAAHLLAMGAFVRGDGPPVYSLAAGCHDHAIGLAIEESARTRSDVRVEGEAWMEE